ncbi:MAG: hypothetical protein R2697_14905 [Ilumatobacteraceae bacterium]
MSRPDIRSPEQARQYVAELRSILLAIEASDAKMEEGSMRVGANVSVRKPGDPLGTRCEIKNVNSVRSVGRAIDYEAKRQIVLIEGGEQVRQQTRHWDEGDGKTHTLRDKEDADDYRYFLEPDLVPLVPERAWVEQVRASIPVLPSARRHPRRGGRYGTRRRGGRHDRRPRPRPVRPRRRRCRGRHRAHHRARPAGVRRRGGRTPGTGRRSRRAHRARGRGSSPPPRPRPSSAI